jgi:D-alanine-D-alanine ligase
MNQTKQFTQLLVLFGGESSEHEVSMLSVRNVYEALDRQKYQVHLAYLTSDGRWLSVRSVDDVDGDVLMPVLGQGKFRTIGGTELSIDVILPILHGKNGEDGSVQGLAQLLHIPIVGCDMTSSGICMDKLATKEILVANHIAIAPYAVHRLYDDKPDFDYLRARLDSPMFVKPARAGSSVGVSKVSTGEELVAALETAHRHDDVVLIEQAIVGRELEVGVLGNPPSHQTSGVGEIVPGEDFYSYDDKYSNTSASRAIISADLDDVTRTHIKRQAALIYELLGCKGLARVDFFYGDDEGLYLNEVNTLPGFTNISMYPKLWAAEGVSYSQLIDRLISLAIDATMK